MDEYSLHQFIIRKGQALDTTPEFASYKRSYLKQWYIFIQSIFNISLGEAFHTLFMNLKDYSKLMRSLLLMLMAKE